MFDCSLAYILLLFQHGTDGTCGEPAFHPGQHVQPAGNTLPFPFRLAFPLPAAQRLREVKARVQNPSTFFVIPWSHSSQPSTIVSLTMWVARLKNWYIHILDFIPWNKFGFSAVISISFYNLQSTGIYIYLCVLCKQKNDVQKLYMVIWLALLMCNMYLKI